VLRVTFGAGRRLPPPCAAQVSFGNLNVFVSGDNRGAASQFVEKASQAAKGPPFVAAFPQTNHGDVSPNIQGAFCGNTSEAGPRGVAGLGPPEPGRDGGC
jgi:hypothetical protein